jgi:hypothetical protein
MKTNGIRVELTAAQRASLQRHTFPKPANGTAIPRINVDVTNGAGGSATTPLVAVNTTTGRVTALAQFEASFGPGRYTIYGCVDFATEGAGGNVQAAGLAEWGIYQSNTPLIDLTDGNQIYLSAYMRARLGPCSAGADGAACRLWVGGRRARRIHAGL